MSDLVLDQLKRLLAQYPDAATGNVERLEALLHDFCRGNRREIALLTAAADEGVPASLRARGAGEIVPLARTLADDRGIMPSAAYWAVETWALALGIARSRSTPPNDLADRGAAKVPEPPRGDPMPPWLKDAKAAMERMQLQAKGSAVARATFGVVRVVLVAVGFVGYGLYLAGKKVVGQVKTRR
jgi:hypothetical protein